MDPFRSSWSYFTPIKGLVNGFHWATYDPYRVTTLLITSRGPPWRVYLAWQKMFSYGSQCSGVTVPWGPKKAFPRSQVHSGGHFVLLSGGSITSSPLISFGYSSGHFLKGCVKIDRWYTDYYICVYIIIFVFCNSLLFKWDVSNRIQSVLANPLFLAACTGHYSTNPNKASWRANPSTLPYICIKFDPSDMCNLITLWCTQTY